VVVHQDVVEGSPVPARSADSLEAGSLVEPPTYLPAAVVDMAGPGGPVAARVPVTVQQVVALAVSAAHVAGHKMMVVADRPVPDESHHDLAPVAAAVPGVPVVPTMVDWQRIGLLLLVLRMNALNFA